MKETQKSREMKNKDYWIGKTEAHRFVTYEEQVNWWRDVDDWNGRNRMPYISPSELFRGALHEKWAPDK